VKESVQERRKFTRIHFDANCKLKTTTGDWPVKLVDICLKGALTEANDAAPLDIGDHAELIITLDGQDIQIEMPVIMNHKLDGHFGFQAQNMELSSVTHLRRLVELNLGDHALLERELDHLYSS